MHKSSKEKPESQSFQLNFKKLKEGYVISMKNRGKEAIFKEIYMLKKETAQTAYYL